MSLAFPTDEQILSVLESSGFIFEQEIATTLEKNDYQVETSWPYLDPDTKKSREIDLRATKVVLKSEKLKLKIVTEILIECKDSDSPFIFFERPKNDRELNRPEPKEFIFPRMSFQKNIQGNEYVKISTFNRLSLASSHYYYKDLNKVTQFTKIVRKGSHWMANHDGIYDSIFLPIAKAVEARISSLPKPSTIIGDLRTIWLLFPVVVLRDHLKVLSITGGQKNIVSKGRVTFVRNLDSDYLKGDYLVDFVTSSYLQNYLEDDLENFIKVFITKALEHPQLFRG